MFSHMENLKIDAIYKGATKKTHSDVICRKTSTFILRTSGLASYTFENARFEAHPGDIMFLPKGSTYTFDNLSGVPCEYVSVSFSADLENPAPALYPFVNFKDADEFVNHLHDMWKFGGKKEHYRCYAIFYNLLSYIETLQKQNYSEKNKLYLISPAVSYLRKHLYDPDLKVDTLSAICGISGTYFRKIFQANYAMPPNQYILEKRLTHAITLIEIGEYNSISEVAASVGYQDPLYFSRVFKKKYGVSPSQYGKGAVAK